MARSKPGGTNTFFIVRDVDEDFGVEEFSYWTTIAKAQAALARYRKLGLISDRGEIVAATLNSDGFTAAKGK